MCCALVMLAFRPTIVIPLLLAWASYSIRKSKPTSAGACAPAAAAVLFGALPASSGPAMAPWTVFVFFFSSTPCSCHSLTSHLTGLTLNSCDSSTPMDPPQRPHPDSLAQQNPPSSSSLPLPQARCPPWSTTPLRLSPRTWSWSHPQPTHTRYSCRCGGSMYGLPTLEVGGAQLQQQPREVCGRVALCSGLDISAGAACTLALRTCSSTKEAQ